MHKYDDQGTHLVTLAPPLLSGSIQDKASCDVDTTATPTERGGDGARVAVIPTNGATRACAKHDDRDQPMTKTWFRVNGQQSWLLTAARTIHRSPA